jgi:excisionase family DNA binding protein
MVDNLSDRTLTSGQVARLLNIHINTLRRWANSGVLPCYRVGPRGDRRFMERDIECFMLLDFPKMQN